MPARTLTRSALLLLAALAPVACADPGDDAPGDRVPGDTAAAPATDGREDARPETRTDTIHLEGMPEPIDLALFRTPEDFPLPFSAYAPADMAVEAEEAEASGEGASVRFIAEFGGRRNPDAFVHVFVFPADTDANAAIAQARGYKASRGIPVSRGIEPLSDEELGARMPWAMRAYSFRYQGEDGWYQGAIGVGTKDGRHFQLVLHYPAEYGDGFGPRAALITQSWRWDDGAPLHPRSGPDDPEGAEGPDAGPAR